MAETAQSFEGLAALKPETPQAPKYVQKLDKSGRAYATGKRKNAVARVWIKPGGGTVTINQRAVEVYFARPVLRMLIQQPLVAANRNGQYDVTCTVSGGGLSGQAGAVRHGISKALSEFRAGPARLAQEGWLPHPRPARGRAQEIRQGQSPPLVPVLQALRRTSSSRRARRMSRTNYFETGPNRRTAGLPRPGRRGPDDRPGGESRSRADPGAARLQHQQQPCDRSQRAAGYGCCGAGVITKLWSGPRPTGFCEWANIPLHQPAPGVPGVLPLQSMGAWVFGPNAFSYG